MRAVDIIVKKRDGHELTADEIRFFVEGYARGDIPDYQAAAWAMAIYFRGMTDAEATEVTLAMLQSGQQIDPRQLFPAGTVVVDKHSTGGVGDKTTLAVAPIVASLGLPVGKLSGRGLGFSGGTIDKLESIAGWSPEVSPQQFVRQLADVGLVVGSQTAELAPADGKLYALRDVTGTVPILPLIAASIMSKKLAAGSDAIVLDVKVGCGAFMRTLGEARHLASLMVQIGQGLGRRMAALITDMNQPLGRAVGNALELREAMDTLHGRGPDDFVQLVVAVAGEMLRLAGRVEDATAGRLLAQQQIASGAAWQKFRDFVAAQGGDLRQLDDPTLLPRATLVEPVVAASSGWLAELQADKIGLATVELGGGRQKKGDVIDHAVGTVLTAKVGDRVEAGQPLAWVHANDRQRLQAARELMLSAVAISPEPVPPPPLIYEVIR